MSQRREVKVFAASVESASEQLIVPIGLTFVNTKTGDMVVEEFDTTCAVGDAGMVLALSSVAHVDSAGKRQTDLNGLLHFYRQVMEEDDFNRFAGLLFDDNDLTIHIDILSDVVMYLIEEFSGRPTEPPPPSSGGRRTTGKTSTERRSLQAATS